MDEIDNGTLTIQFGDDTEIIITDFEYYTVQLGFLVVTSAGEVNHFNVNTIESFQYTPKETN